MSDHKPSLFAGLQHLGRPMSAPISQAGPPSFFQTQSMPAGDDQQELDNILDDLMNIESQWDGPQRESTAATGNRGKNQNNSTGLTFTSWTENDAKHFPF